MRTLGLETRTRDRAGAARRRAGTNSGPRADACDAALKKNRPPRARGDDAAPATPRDHHVDGRQAGAHTLTCATVPRSRRRGRRRCAPSAQASRWSRLRSRPVSRAISTSGVRVLSASAARAARRPASPSLAVRARNVRQRQRRNASPLSDSSDCTLPVSAYSHVGRHTVADEHVGTPPLEASSASLDRRDRPHQRAPVLQHRAQQLAPFALLIQHEHAQPFEAARRRSAVTRWRRDVRGRLAGCSGKRAMKIAPLPPRGCRLDFPALNLHQLADQREPDAEPPARPRRRRSACVNRSKTRGRNSGRCRGRCPSRSAARPGRTRRPRPRPFRRAA